MIKRNTDLYDAIENAIYTIFEGEIPLEDPMVTLEMFISSINKEMDVLNNDEG